MSKQSVNTFFDDFITKDSDWIDENFDVLDGKQSSPNLKETGAKIEVELATPEIKKDNFTVEMDNEARINSSEKEEIRKTESFPRKQFNYRSFCRLPNL
jgi:HSP20 family protein